MKQTTATYKKFILKDVNTGMYLVSSDITTHAGRHTKVSWVDSIDLATLFTSVLEIDYDTRAELLYEYKNITTISVSVTTTITYGKEV